MDKHLPHELKQMQSLPLEAKIRMTKERIEAWYESWWRYEIRDNATGKARFVTFDNRDYYATPPMKETEFIESATPGAVYVSFSGGKDSTVLKHIVDSMYSDVPAVFVNTGLEYPEIQHFVREVKAGKYDCFNPDVEILRPEMRFDEVIQKYGYPVVSKDISRRVSYAQKGRPWALNAVNGLNKDGTESEFKQRYKRYARLVDAPFRVSDNCCAVMKKKPAKLYEKQTGRKGILGAMASESKQREQAWLRTGCNAFESKRPKSQPMSFWTEQDVLHYIKKFNVPYCPVYGDIQVKQKVDNETVFAGQMNMIDYLGCYEPEDTLETTGCNRTGCMFCMFGCHLEKEPNRFQRMKVTHPRQYEYCICGGEIVNGEWQPNKEGLGLGHVLDYIGVKYD